MRFSGVRKGLLGVILLTLLLPGTVSAGESGGALVLGIYPFSRPSDLMKRFSPLAEYLAKALGRPIRIDIAPDYKTHIKRVGEDRVDIAYLGPVPYIQVVEGYGAKPLLAQLEVQGTNTFRGVIITRRENGLERLEDLAGKRFAFGDPASTMSHLVPRYMLLRAGIDMDKLGSYGFAGNHMNVALSVLAGMFDAGAIKEGVFHHYEARGLRILARTDPVANHLFVARKGLSAETADTLRSAMYGLREKTFGRVILRAVNPALTDLVPARDERFDDLRAILKALAREGVAP